MRGLSLTQPFASLIAFGEKKIETRSWSTNYRGPVAIHATKSFPIVMRANCWLPAFGGALIRSGINEPWMLPLGAILAVGKIIGCGRTEEFAGIDAKERGFGDYSPGRYGWVIADVRRLNAPIPCKGALGLWAVPRDVMADIVDLESERLAE